MLVVEIKTEDQMRVTSVSDDKIVCLKGGIKEVAFSPEEIMEFDQYWASKKRK